MSDQYESNVTRILRLMKSTFGEDFKQYYDGDPRAIPSFNLPCIIVTQESDDTNEGAQSEDDIEDQLIIKVVFNQKDDYTGDKVDPLNLTEKKVRDIVARRDPDTGRYADKTIKGAVRGMALNGITAVAGAMHVEYGFSPRPMPGEDYAELTTEAHVSFSIQYSVFTD